MTWDAGRVNKRFVRKYNAKEFFGFTKDKEAQYELIDGRIYMMAAPSVSHQRISREISLLLGGYLRGKACEMLVAPTDVVLFKKEEKSNVRNVFQPDILVVRDPKKIGANRINGAPDFIIEIISPGTAERDYIDKARVYIKYGVREYWIVDPVKRTVLVHRREGKELDTANYTFADRVGISIFEDFGIDFKDLDL